MDVVTRGESIKIDSAFGSLAAALVSTPFIVIQGHFNSLVVGAPILLVRVLYVALHVMDSRTAH